MKDISYAEFRNSYMALAVEIGPKAIIHPSFNDHGKMFWASIYPYGITGSSFKEDGYLRVEADTLSELIEKLRSEWGKFSETHNARVVRKMALAIIRITAELGECTDAALRNEFDAGQVNRFGERACADANEMAGKGPFAIVVRGGANGAPENIAVA